MYKQICEYAVSLNIPMMLNISQDPIPANVIVPYRKYLKKSIYKHNNKITSVLFAGIDKPVVSGVLGSLYLMAYRLIPVLGRTIWNQM